MVIQKTYRVNRGTVDEISDKILNYLLVQQYELKNRKKHFHFFVN